MNLDELRERHRLVEAAESQLRAARDSVRHLAEPDKVLPSTRLILDQDLRFLSSRREHLERLLVGAQATGHRTEAG